MFVSGKLDLMVCSVLLKGSYDRKTDQTGFSRKTHTHINMYLPLLKIHHTFCVLNLRLKYLLSIKILNAN